MYAEQRTKRKTDFCRATISTVWGADQLLRDCSILAVMPQFSLCSSYCDYQGLQKINWNCNSELQLIAILNCNELQFRKRICNSFSSLQFGIEIAELQLIATQIDFLQTLLVTTDWLYSLSLTHCSSHLLETFSFEFFSYADLISFGVLMQLYLLPSLPRIE
jgi:hypothetical protein